MCGYHVVFVVVFVILFCIFFSLLLFCCTVMKTRGSVLNVLLCHKSQFSKRTNVFATYRLRRSISIDQ